MTIPIGMPGSASPFGPDRTPFSAIGGEAAVRALVDRFYDRMGQQPDFKGIRSLHPPELTQSREKLFEFLCGWLGGPDLYVRKHGHPRLRARHMPFAIGDAERDQWMACMSATLDECHMGEELKAFLLLRFQQVADFMRNR
jgi:hemoglobin